MKAIILPWQLLAGGRRCKCRLARPASRLSPASINHTENGQPTDTSLRQFATDELVRRDTDKPLIIHTINLTGIVMQWSVIQDVTVTTHSVTMGWRLQDRRTSYSCGSQHHTDLEQRLDSRWTQLGIAP